MRKIISVVLLIAMIILIMPITSYADNSGAVVTDFSVNSQEVGLYSENEVHFHLKVPDDKHIAMVACSFYTSSAKKPGNEENYDAIQGSLGKPSYASVLYDSGSSETDVTVTVKPGNYGVWRIERILVDYAEGGGQTFYNALLDHSGVDMSGSEFSITGDPNDTKGPVLSGPFTSSAKTLQQKQTEEISFNAKDDNDIALVVLCLYREDEDSNNSYYYDSQTFYNFNYTGDGNITFSIQPEEIGPFEISSILILDTSLNVTRVYNSNWKGNYPDRKVQMDMSGADFAVLSRSSEKDKEPPIIRADTLRVKNYRTSFGEGNEISVAVEDKSEIEAVSFVYMINGNDNMRINIGGEYDAETNRYIGRLWDCNYFGEWQCLTIGANDIYGNRFALTNNNLLKQGETIYSSEGPELEWYDLSNGDFLCGLADDDSDVFVSGKGMDDTATLHVDEVGEDDPEHASLVDAMLEPQYEEESLYKIKMTGNYSENNSNVSVSFPIESIPNGERIRIRHLQSDGSLQTEDAVVTRGRADIEVSEFSPFLLEVPAFKDIYNAEIKGPGSSVTYNGKRIRPEIKVYYEGKELVKNKDYTVSYGDNKNVGTGVITVTGTGEYGYSKTIKFAINPKGTSLKKLTRGKKAFTVKWKKLSTKMSKSRVDGYQIQYSTSGDFSTDSNTVTIKGYKKTSKKISKLKAKKKYFVRIRTYKKIGSGTNYSAWSKSKSVVTN